MNLNDLEATDPWEWPEEAAESILAVLRDPSADPDQLRLATELAGEYVVINDDLAEALLKIVGTADAPEQVRGQAALSLGPAMECADTEGFDDPEEVPISEPLFERLREALRQIYQDQTVPDEVRRCVLETSTRAPQEWHADAVRAAHRMDDPAWRHAALLCMSYIPGFEPQILEALKSDDEEMEFAAIHAAGNWGIDAAWDHVSACALDPAADKELRLVSIDALFTIRPTEAVDILFALSSNEDEEIAEAALDALALTGAMLEEEEEEDENERD